MSALSHLCASDRATRPEICAQATLVNFCVTIEGLEEQLLAVVVVRHKPGL